MVSKNPLIEIETGSDSIYYYVKKAFSEISSNKNGNALFTSFSSLNKVSKIKEELKNNNLSISYNGDFISFEMSIGPYKVRAGNKYEIYYNSNEEYSKATIEDIAKLSNIKGYFGISGGLTQVFTHISALREKNSFEEVTLCDVNHMQLLYNSMQLVRYDVMGDSINPLWHIKVNDSVEARKAFFRYGQHKIEGLRFKLVNSDFGELLSKINYGSNFIYSSNAYGISFKTSRQGREFSTKNCWNGNESGERIISLLRSSNNIGDGSVYMGTSVDSGGTIMLRKEKKDIKLYSYCSNAQDHNLCKHN